MLKIITPTVYTKIKDKEGKYKKGDPKCAWCDTNKNLFKNETTGTYCCESCKNQ